MLLRFLKKISFLIIFITNTKADHLYEKRECLEEKILKEISQSDIINIYGLSGMGKSVIAKMLSERLESKGKLVFWFDWDKSIYEQIENYHKKIHKTIRYQKNISCDNFFDILKSFKRVYIFVDNYNNENIKTLRKKFDNFLNLKNTKFIITNNYKIDEVDNILISSFNQREAVSLMQKYFPKTDREKLKKLTLRLANSPYIIATLCRFVSSSMTYNIQRVEEVIDTDPTFLIKKDIFPHELRGHRAVKKMIEEIKNTEPDVYDVLCFLSVLSPKSIPLNLIHNYVGSKDKADNVLKKIDKNAFISCVNKNDDFISYDVHDITQKLLKDMMTQEDKEKILQKGLVAFINLFKNDFSKISNANREDQIFYNHARCFIDFFKEEKSIVPLKILFLKRAIYSTRDCELSALPESKDIEKDHPEDIVFDQDILFEYYVDCGFVHCFYYGGNKHHFKKGIDFVNKAIVLAEKQKNIHQIFKACSRLMWLQIYQGNLEGGKNPLKKATALNPDIKDPYLKKEYFYGSSWYFLENGEFKKSYELACQGIQFDEISKNSNMGLYFRLYQSICEYRLGMHDKALKTIDEALQKEFLRFGNTPSLIHGELLQVKAMIKRDCNDLKTAEELVHQSLYFFKKILGNSPYLSHALSLKILGNILLKSGKLKEAEERFNQSLSQYRALIEPHNWTYDFAELFVFMSEFFLLKKDFQNFKKFYEELKLCPFREMIIKVQNLAKEKEWLIMS